MEGMSSDNVSYSPPVSSTLCFRPRGMLARAVFEKHQTDKYLKAFNKNKWYDCDLRQLPESIASKFVQLSPDEESLNFIKKSEEKSDSIIMQIWHTIVKALLGWFMTQTSINGLLRRGSMHVISFDQFLKLLATDGDLHKNSLMDLGAGDGAVTAQIAPLFEKVFVTEMSCIMRSLLKSRGYTVLDVDTWDLDRKFDVIACMNLIDRCNTPLQLLKQIRGALRPDGIVLLALVLPFSAYVEIGSRNHRPQELLPIMGETFEEQVASVIHDVLEPVGFRVQSWSRVPYLCEGDLRQSYFWLDDAIFILKI